MTPSAQSVVEWQIRYAGCMASGPFWSREEAGEWAKKLADQGAGGIVIQKRTVGRWEDA